MRVLTADELATVIRCASIGGCLLQAIASGDQESEKVLRERYIRLQAIVDRLRAAEAIG